MKQLHYHSYLVIYNLKDKPVIPDGGLQVMSGIRSLSIPNGHERKMQVKDEDRHVTYEAFEKSYRERCFADGGGVSNDT